MTREKAIDLLDNLVGMIDDNHGSDYDTALKMGIQALQKERLKENRDCFHCKYFQMEDARIFIGSCRNPLGIAIIVKAGDARSKAHACNAYESREEGDTI